MTVAYDIYLPLMGVVPHQNSNNHSPHAVFGGLETSTLEAGNKRLPPTLLLIENDAGPKSGDALVDAGYLPFHTVVFFLTESLLYPLFPIDGRCIF